MTNNSLQKNGTVKTFNISPKGGYEGLILETAGETIQLNFPRELAPMIVDITREGDGIDVEIEPEKAHGHASHPVYRLVRVTNAEHSTVSVHRASQRFSGKVKAFNYALHGEVNGAILESGDFVHMKPDGAASMQLAVGMKLEGSGVAKPGFNGRRVIEAEEINGLRLDKKPKPKKAPKQTH